MRRLIAVLGALVVAYAWGAAPSTTDGSWSNKVEVGQVEYGVAVGHPGISLRLTLLSGQAVEYRGDDSAEAAALIGMADLFLSGRARMFAEVEGTEVRAVQVAGPALAR